MPVELTAIIKHLIEYAPAVAVLLYLQFRAERRLDAFFDQCLKHLIADANREDGAHENSNSG